MKKTTPKFSGLKNNIYLVHISIDWKFGLSSARPSWAVPLNSAELTHASMIKWQYSASLIVGQLANCTLEYWELTRPHVSSSNRLASLFHIVAVGHQFPRAVIGEASISKILLTSSLLQPRWQCSSSGQPTLKRWRRISTLNEQSYKNTFNNLVQGKSLFSFLQPTILAIPEG